MSTKKTTNHDVILKAWIDATNTHDQEKYLSFFTDDVVLDDPSVGLKFEGKAGLGKYFDDYVVGYNTKTRLASVEPEDRYIHVEVHFTGEFPGGETGGILDIIFRGDEISFVRADLTQ